MCFNNGFRKYEGGYCFMGRLSKCRVSLLLAGVFLFTVIMGVVGVQPAWADSDPPVYANQYTISDANKKVTLFFNELIYYNKIGDAEIIDGINHSKDGDVVSDSIKAVSISGKTLVIEFNQALTGDLDGAGNSIIVASNTLKDAFDNVLADEITVAIFLDIINPVIDPAYPKLANDLGTSVDLLVKANKSGTAYYVVLNDGATPPSQVQVKNGGALPDNRKGTMPLSADTEAVKNITGLTTGTEYDIYVVAEDEATGNLSLVKTIKKENTGPPDFEGGTPNIETYETSLQLSVRINKDGMVYYVVLARGEDAPTAQQVRAGTNANGYSLSANNKGSIPLTLGISSSATVTGLVANTGYDIYVVAESNGNLQDNPVLREITTQEAGSLFSISSGYPKVTGDAGTLVKLLVKINKAGKAYYVVLDEGATAPSKEQIKLGRNGLSDPLPANLKGIINLTANTEVTETITGLSTGTVYNIYVLAEGDGKQISAMVSTTTTSLPVMFDGLVASNSYNTSNNTIKIDVKTADAADVKFGSEVTVSRDGTVTTKKTGLGAKREQSNGLYVHTVENYPLKAGNNNITINITYQDGSKQTLKYTVNSADAVSTDAQHYTGDISKQTKVSAFGKVVSLDFGRGNSIKNSGGAVIAGDKGQSIMIIARSTPETANLPTGFVPISPFFEVKAGHQVHAVAEYRLDKQAKLTINYTGLGAVPDNITVWRANNASFTIGRENLGGLVNQKTGTITIQIEGPFYGHYAVFNSHIGAENYTDLPIEGWFYHPVTALSAKGIMEAANILNNPWNYVDAGSASTFGLSSGFKINRGEFAFMMVRALGISLVDIPYAEDNTIFEDVNDSNLERVYRQSIETAARNGLIYGFPSGDFGWNESLTREQAAAIMARAAVLKLDTREAYVNTALAKIYTDYEDISPWARSSVLACNRAKVMEGFDDGTFKAIDQLTRAQAASLIYRFMQNKKLI